MGRFLVTLNCSVYWPSDIDVNLTPRTGNHFLDATAKSNDYVKIPEFILLTLGAYVVTRYIQLGNRIDILATIRIELLLGLFLLVLCLIVPKQKLATKPNIAPYVTFLYIVVLISIVNSVNIGQSWSTFWDRVFKFSLFALFISCLVTSPKGLKYFMAAFFLACGKIIQEGVIGWWSGSLVWENQGVPRLHGSVPIYVHPNSLAGLAVGLLPFLAFSFMYFKQRLLKIGVAGFIACSLLVILFTGSRTAYLAVFGLIFYAFSKSNKKIKYTLYALIVGAIAINFIPDHYVNRFASSFGVSTGEEEYTGGESSRQKRIEILEDAVVIFIQNPLGVGIGGFPEVRREMFGRKQDTHNLYLEILTNMGVLGGVAFTLFIVVLMRRLISTRNSAQEQRQKIYKACGGELNEEASKQVDDLTLIEYMARSVEMFLIARLFLGFFGMDFYEIYWWFALGLTSALFKINQVAERKTETLLKGSTIDSASGEQPKYGIALKSGTT